MRERGFAFAAFADDGCSSKFYPTPRVVRQGERIANGAKR